jgi:hypothetical protein
VAGVWCAVLFASLGTEQRFVILKEAKLCPKFMRKDITEEMRNESLIHVHVPCSMVWHGCWESFPLLQKFVQPSVLHLFHDTFLSLVVLRWLKRWCDQ